MTSLTELVRNRFLSNVEAITTSGDWKVVVMDQVSHKIFSSVAELSDLLNLNVKAIETLNSSRPKSLSDTAIYFCLPSSENITTILNDFDSENRKYKSAHLFFISSIREDQFERLTTRNLIWLAFESKVFNFDNPSSFISLFAAPQNYKDYEVRNIASKLISVCTTLGENPIVRYQTAEKGESVAKSIATTFQLEFDTFLKKNPDFVPTNTTASRPTLLILDRTVDLFSPLLHEMTYQALCNEVFDIEDGRKHKNMECVDEVILSEADEIWERFRHLHIADASQRIKSQYTSMIESNAAASNLIKRSQSQLEEVGVPSVKEMQEVIAAVPELQLLGKQNSVHINLATACLDLVTEPLTQDLIEVEQSLATGLDAELEKLLNPLSSLTPILNNPNLLQTYKVRLLALFKVFTLKQKNSLEIDVDWRRLENFANLSDSDKKLIANLAMLDVSRPKEATRTNTTLMSNLFQRTTDPSNDDDVIDPTKINYMSSRYIPRVKKLLEKVVKKSLSPTQFPYTDPKITADQMLGLQVKSGLRVAKPRWQKKKRRAMPKSKSNGSGNLNGEEHQSINYDFEDNMSILSNKGRLLVFIAGGATYSELRSIYEVSRSHHLEVFLGTTNILRPKDFLDLMRELNSGKLPHISELAVNESFSNTPQTVVQLDQVSDYSNSRPNSRLSGPRDEKRLSNSSTSSLPMQSPSPTYGSTLSLNTTPFNNGVVNGLTSRSEPNLSNGLNHLTNSSSTNEPRYLPHRDSIEAINKLYVNGNGGSQMNRSNSDSAGVLDQKNLKHIKPDLPPRPKSEIPAMSKAQSEGVSNLKRSTTNSRNRVNPRTSVRKSKPV